MLVLFDKYAELLKSRFSDDFQEASFFHSFLPKAKSLEQIVSTDDYMPMAITSMDEYDKVVNVSWYTSDKSREDLVYVGVYLFYRPR